MRKGCPLWLLELRFQPQKEIKLVSALNILIYKVRLTSIGGLNLKNCLVQAFVDHVAMDIGLS